MGKRLTYGLFIRKNPWESSSYKDVFCQTSIEKTEIETHTKTYIRYYVRKNPPKNRRNREITLEYREKKDEKNTFNRIKGNLT